MAHIVLIEDDRDLCGLLIDSLRVVGHTVATARDGEEGVALCERERADVIVTDLVVPNAYALTALPAVAKAAPIIVISGGLDFPEPRKLAQRLGAAHLLAKPFRTTELVRLVNAIVQDAPACGA